MRSHVKPRRQEGMEEFLDPRMVSILDEKLQARSSRFECERLSRHPVFTYQEGSEGVKQFQRLASLCVLSTALNDALRASILEGTPLVAQWGRISILALWGGVSFLLALR
jgi:hypothetical protein